MSSGNDKINSIIKKFAFHQSIKAIKIIKRIINDLDIKKPSSGEIPTYFLKKCNFILDTATVCVNEALKTGSFPDSLKCANVRPIYKKVDPFDKNQWVYYHFY